MVDLGVPEDLEAATRRVEDTEGFRCNEVSILRLAIEESGQQRVYGIAFIEISRSSTRPSSITIERSSIDFHLHEVEFSAHEATSSTALAGPGGSTFPST